MKLVKEHINEVFKDQSDPISDLGIGIEQLEKEFSEYRLSDVLNGLSDKDIEKVESFFNADIKHIFYLGDNKTEGFEYRKFKYNSSYIEYLKKLINSGKKTVSEKYSDGNILNSNGQLEYVIFSGYETEIGKIATFDYSENEPRVIQYIGDAGIAYMVNLNANVT